MTRFSKINARATVERGLLLLLGVCVGILMSVAYGRSGPREVQSAPAQSEPTRAWTFAQGLPDSWTAVPGTGVLERARGVRVSTTRLRFGYQLLSEPLVVEPGSYRADVQIGVNGGVGLVVLDVARDRFLASASRRAGDGKLMNLGATMSVRRRVKVRIILTNFSLRDRSSDWLVRKVSLGPSALLTGSHP